MSNFLITVIRSGMVVLGQWFVVGVMTAFGAKIGEDFFPSFTSVFLGAAFGLFLGEWVIRRSFK